MNIALTLLLVVSFLEWQAVAEMEKQGNQYNSMVTLQRRVYSFDLNELPPQESPARSDRFDPGVHSATSASEPVDRADARRRKRKTMRDVRTRRERLQMAKAGKNNELMEWKNPNAARDPLQTKGAYVLKAKQQNARALSTWRSVPENREKERSKARERYRQDAQYRLRKKRSRQERNAKRAQSRTEEQERILAMDRERHPSSSQSITAGLQTHDIAKRAPLYRRALNFDLNEPAAELPDHQASDANSHVPPGKADQSIDSWKHKQKTAYAKNYARRKRHLQSAREGEASAPKRWLRESIVVYQGESNQEFLERIQRKNREAHRRWLAKPANRESVRRRERERARQPSVIARKRREYARRKARNESTKADQAALQKRTVNPPPSEAQALITKKRKQGGGRPALKLSEEERNQRIHEQRLKAQRKFYSKQGNYDALLVRNRERYRTNAQFRARVRESQAQYRQGHGSRSSSKTQSVARTIDLNLSPPASPEPSRRGRPRLDISKEERDIRESEQKRRAQKKWYAKKRSEELLRRKSAQDPTFDAPSIANADHVRQDAHTEQERPPEKRSSPTDAHQSPSASQNTSPSKADDLPSDAAKKVPPVSRLSLSLEERETQRRMRAKEARKKYRSNPANYQRELEYQRRRYAEQPSVRERMRKTRAKREAVKAIEIQKDPQLLQKEKEKYTAKLAKQKERYWNSQEIRERKTIYAKQRYMAMRQQEHALKDYDRSSQSPPET